jgi:hypothetical protein
LLCHYGKLPFNLDFYTEMLDLTPMAQYVASPYRGEEPIDVTKPEVVAAPKAETQLAKKYKKMTEQLCEVLSDYGLVSFLPVNIEDAGTVARALTAIDKANGYTFAASGAKDFKENGGEPPMSQVINALYFY